MIAAHLIPTKPIHLELVESPQIELPISQRHFQGEGYKTMEDHERLNSQHYRVKNAMKDGRWRTVNEIHEITGDPHESIGRQLRFLEEPGFGSHKKNRRLRGPGRGLYEYQIIINPKEQEAANRRYFFKKHPKPFQLTPPA